MNKFDLAEFDRLTGRGNFLGAYEYLKNSDLDKQQKTINSSELAAQIVDKLSATPRTDKEGAAFLRSVLLYMFRDYPGLASIYREQLRFAHGSAEPYTGLLRGMKNVADVASGKKSVEEGLEDAGQDIREGLESDVGPGLESLAREAAKGVELGLKGLADLFGNLTGQQDAAKTATDETEVADETEVSAQKVKIEDGDDDTHFKKAQPPKED